MTTPVIEIDHLSHRFEDGRTGLSDLSATIQKGEFIILAGKNGSGKTTLIRHLNGLLLPTAGAIRINGRDVSKDLFGARKTVGMVFQDSDTQIVSDTVFDETAFGLENLKTERRIIDETVAQILTQLDLYDLKDKSPALLSGGQKRRLAIAGILVMHPEVIVFDEPFSNLDYPAILTVLNAMVALNRSGKTLIIAAHDIEPLICEATRMMIMDQGELKKDGAPFDLIEDLAAFGIRPPCPFKTGQKPISWLA